MIRSLLLILCLAFAGCAAKGTTVVLIQDPDGSVGQVEVSTAAGAQSLTTAGQSTLVKDSTAAPGPLLTLDQATIEKDFGRALHARPEPPETFLLYFEYGRAELIPESQSEPAMILETILRRNSHDVRINGHSDTVGTREDNARLSLERAKGARDILVNKGVDPSRIQIFSHGEGNPLISTPDETPEPRNRRVEVLVR